ncbi:hypothetical protein COOONC_03087 [Cooperia oncophora]
MHQRWRSPSPPWRDENQRVKEEELRRGNALTAGGQLTDISGRVLCYDSSVQRNNTGGVLASAPWVNHQEYIVSIPKFLKDQLPEIAAKS